MTARFSGRAGSLPGIVRAWPKTSRSSAKPPTRYNPEATHVLNEHPSFFASPWTPRAQIKQMTQIRHRCYRTNNTGALTVRIIVVVVLPTISVRRGEWPYAPIVNIASGV
jgi:uncharacterized membrane protein